MKRIRLTAILLCSVLLFSACNSQISGRYKRDTYFFNTTSILYAYDNFAKQKNVDKLDGLWNEVQSKLAEIENAISSSEVNSDIYKFNALSESESLEISSLTADIIKIAKRAYEDTDGLYDPTVYPLVDLWGFSPRCMSDDFTVMYPYDRVKNPDGSFSLPDKKYIDGFLSLVGFDKITLSGDNESGYTLTKNVPSVTIDGITYDAKIDLGGVGKGYTCDIITDLMKKSNYDCGYFSCGSSSITLLSGNPEKNVDFSLEIKKPREGNDADKSTFIELNISNASVSTSGDYEHCYFVDGKRYSHIISPKTGYPMNTTDGDGVIAITLIGDSAAYLDCISTAMCLMSESSCVDFYGRLNGTDCFITSETIDGKLVVRTFTDKNYQITDDGYVVYE